jgi:hypothetical protein
MLVGGQYHLEKNPVKVPQKLHDLIPQGPVARIPPFYLFVISSPFCLSHVAVRIFLPAVKIGDFTVKHHQRNSLVKNLYLLLISFVLSIPNLRAELYFLKLPDGLQNLEIDSNETVTVLRDKIRTLGGDPDKTTYQMSGAGKKFIKDFADGITIQSLGVRNNAIFTSVKLELDAQVLKAQAEAVLKRDFLLKAFSDEEDKHVNHVSDTLEKMSPDEKMEFLKSTLALDDHKKSAIHYAARKGNIKFLDDIRKSVGDDNFALLLRVKDDEGRTPLMFAGQAVKNKGRPPSK